MAPWLQPNLVWNSCKNWDQNKKQGLALCSQTESLSFGSTSADKKRPKPHTAARNGVQKKHFDRKLKIVHITRISRFEASNLIQRLPSIYILRKYMSELGPWIVDPIYSTSPFLTQSITSTYSVSRIYYRLDEALYWRIPFHQTRSCVMACFSSQHITEQNSPVQRNRVIHHSFSYLLFR